MEDHRALEVLKEAKRRFGVNQSAKLLDSLFPQQRAFLDDPNRFKAALCTRRAGKSHTEAAGLYDKALSMPGTTSLYIALTRDSAKEIIWPVLTEMNDTFNLGAELTESNLIATLPNKSRIRCVGADMKNFIKRLRGPKYAMAVIDEMQDFGSHVEELIDDVLVPALGDYRGPLWIMGTPGAIPMGIFYDTTREDATDPGYSVHRWSIRDNPHFPDPAGFIADEMKRKKWTVSNPTYQREYCGKWVIDRDALVYKFNPDKNVYLDLPKGHEFYRILAIDYGYNDQTAFGIVAYSPTLREVYAEHVEGHSQMIPSKIAERVEELRAHYNPIRIVADTGGLGKSITEEMIQRYLIPIEPAVKTEKLTAISLLNGDFIDKNLWISSSLKNLHEQYQKLVKDDNGMEKAGLPNDLCDCILYAYRDARHYLGEPPKSKPQPGSDAWAKAEIKRMEEAAIEEIEGNESQPWWAK